MPERKPMSLEVLSTIFAGLTFAVIAATAIAAIVQLRHLRASNQMNALLALMQLWESPEMQRYFQYTFNELPKKLKDPEFLALFNAGALSRTDHPELLVADYWEQIGAYAKHGLFDEASWLDIASAQVLRSWQVLEPIIAARRKSDGNQATFENFEYLAVRATLWNRRYPDGNWRPGLPRMADLGKS
jgi:Domain of unknown function (DUF4760)